MSATPRFPRPLRDAAATFTAEALGRLTAAERDGLRVRHVHGDGQIATLYGIMRSFEDSFQRLGLARIDILYVHDIGTYQHGPEAHPALMGPCHRPDGTPGNNI